MNLSAAIGVLIGAGAAARVSIFLGQGDKLKAEMTLGNSLVMIILNATIYLSFFGIFMDDLLTLFGASARTLPYAKEFMMHILPGMLVMNIMYSMNNVMRASGYPKLSMITMFIGAGCNLIFAPIFIFGLDMGIKGAAIATDISMAVGAAFVIAHFCKKSSTLHFRRGIYRLNWRIIWAIISIGAAPSIVNFCASAINAIINRSLLEYGGDMAVGAVGIFSTYTSLLCMVVVGLCQGVQPILGYNYGAGLYERMRKAYWAAAVAGTCVTAFGAVFSVFFPQYIAQAFTVDPELIAATVNGLHIATIMFWPVGFQIVSTTLFQSIGMAGKSIFLSLIRQVIFLIPLLMILPSHFGLNGVWASFPTSDIGATLVSILMVYYQFHRMPRQLRPQTNP